MEFSVTHRDDSDFEGGGLRGFFEYRDLGIKRSTGGKVGAHVIRAVPVVWTLKTMVPRTPVSGWLASMTEGASSAATSGLITPPDSTIVGSSRITSQLSSRLAEVHGSPE